MSPRKRSKAQQGLPTRWRFRKNFYWYLPREGERPYFDNKVEFKLGRTLAEAHRVFAERIALLTDPTGAATMDALCDLYVRKALPAKKPQSISGYPEYIQRIRAVYGRSPVDKIQTKHIYQLYDALKPKGLNQANKHMSVLSDMFSHAIRWGIIQHHPMTGGKFRKELPKPDQRYIEDWELIEALKVAPAVIRAYVELKWLTGLRRTDLLSLRWSDISEKGTDAGITVRTSKTGAGQHFEMTDDLREVLELVKSARPRVGSVFLFANRNGQCYLDGNKKASGFDSMWQRWQTKAIAKTSLKQKFQERKIRNKVGDDSDDVNDAQRRLGHKSAATTSRFYRTKPQRVAPLKRKKDSD